MNVPIEQCIEAVLEAIPYKMRSDPTFSLVPLISAIEGSGLTMVEVGSFTGESTEAFALSGKFKQITAVDAWSNDVKSEAFVHCDMALAEQLFILRTYKYKIIRRMRSPSILASHQFPDHSIDFVYIDADHEYNNVSDDISHWLPKVRQSGYIGGHDFSIYFPGVVMAVQEVFPNPILFPDSSWLVKL